MSAVETADEIAIRLAEQQRKADETAAAIRREAQSGVEYLRETFNSDICDSIQTCHFSLSDKEKLMACASSLRSLVIPTVTSEQARAVADVIATKQAWLVGWIEQECSVL